MKLVLDTSVIIKWIFPEHPEESHVPAALALLQKIKTGDIELHQPPHWLAEVAAVCVRLNSAVATEAVILLEAMDFPVVGTIDVYRKACEISNALQHHLFDTLYHAIALCDQSIQLVTADHHYYRKAKRLGSIMTLADFETT